MVDHKATRKPELSTRTIVIQRNSDGVAILPCLRTLGVLVDDDVYLKYVSQKCWLSSPDYPTISQKRKPVVLHRVIMNAKPGEVWDHKNQNKMDARRQNLEKVTMRIVNHNKPVSKSKKSSTFMGVFKTTGDLYFEVRIVKDGISHTGGRYLDEHVAAFAADQLSLELYIFKDRKAIRVDVENGNATTENKKRKLL